MRTSTHAADGFRRAVEAKDIDGIIETLDPGVTFRSPVMPKPYGGHAAVKPLLVALSEVLEGFRYDAEFSGRTVDAGEPEASRNLHALLFNALVDGKPLTGIDVLAIGRNGLIGEVTVLVRPLTVAHVLAARVGRKLR